MKYGELTRGQEEVILNKIVAAGGGDEGVLMKIVQGTVTIILNVVETAKQTVNHIVATYTDRINYDRSVTKSLKAGRYDWSNPNITDTNFPSTESGKGEVEVVEFWFNRNISSEDAVAEMDRAGYRPATMKEGLNFGEKHPKVQLDHPVVMLGSVAVVDGYRQVLVLHRNGAGRNANLNYWDGGWFARYRFLAVRKTSIS